MQKVLMDETELRDFANNYVFSKIQKEDLEKILDSLVYYYKKQNEEIESLYDQIDEMVNSPAFDAELFNKLKNN